MFRVTHSPPPILFIVGLKNPILMYDQTLFERRLANEPFSCYYLLREEHLHKMVIAFFLFHF